jgi:hypothetical protein
MIEAILIGLACGAVVALLGIWGGKLLYEFLLWWKWR